MTTNARLLAPLLLLACTDGPPDPQPSQKGRPEAEPASLPRDHVPQPPPPAAGRAGTSSPPDAAVQAQPSDASAPRDGAVDTTASGADGAAGAVAADAGAGADAAAGAGSASVCVPGQAHGLPLPASVVLSEIPIPKLEFLEGPVWLAKGGYLLFSGWNWADATDGKGPPTTIFKLDPVTKAVEPWSDKGSLRTNGLAVDREGNLVVAAHDKQEIARVDLGTKARTTVAAAFEGKTFNSPNDLAVRSDGNIYFTDPDYQRDGRAGQGTLTGVYRVRPGGIVTAIDRARRQPNGLTLSPDESWLYVAAADGEIKRHPVSADGSVGRPQTFIVTEPKVGADGLAMDCAGNIYATYTARREIRIYDAKGAEIGMFSTGVDVTNVAFGGAARKTLYITTAGKLFAVDLKVPGFPY